MFKKFLLLALLALSIPALHAQTVAYVVNEGSDTISVSNSISVIDTSTNTVTATIPMGNFPQGVTFTPDGTRAYVTNAIDSISVIDTASNTVVATVPLPIGSFPGFPAITPDGKSLYVPTTFSGNVVVVSTATNSVTATISVGLLPNAVAITPDGAHAYVVGLNVVSVLDTATNTVVQSIAVNSFPGESLVGIAITPGGGDVYVGGGFVPVVTVIATATNTVVATIPVSQTAIGVAITPDGSRVYVGDIFLDVVDVIDTATNTLEPSSIPVGHILIALAVTPDGAFVYAVNVGDNTVSVISTATNTVVAVVPVGNGPGAIAIANLTTPFSQFAIKGLTINSNGFTEASDLTLGATSAGLDLAHQPLTLTIDSFSLTIPGGSFRQVGGNMHFVFNGTINGLSVSMTLIANKGTSTVFRYSVTVTGVDLTGQPNPATVGLKIGENSGTSTASF